MLIGYARVSTQDQNLELQLAALVNEGCQKESIKKCGAITQIFPLMIKSITLS